MPFMDKIALIAREYLKQIAAEAIFCADFFRHTQGSVEAETVYALDQGGLTQ
jgi:hypothetical protein